VIGLIFGHSLKQIPWRQSAIVVCIELIKNIFPYLNFLFSRVVADVLSGLEAAVGTDPARPRVVKSRTKHLKLQLIKKEEGGRFGKFLGDEENELRI